MVFFIIMKNNKNIQSEKSIDVLVKLNINSMEASTKEPIGPTLGQYGVSIGEFCNVFNTSTNIYEEKVPLRAHVLIFTDKTFELNLQIPTIFYFLKKSMDGMDYDFFQFKRKAGYIDLRIVYLPIYDKNTIFTIVKFVSENLSSVLHVQGLFKKIKGIINSAGFHFKY